ncbi:sigma-70 family RNA polymerase sigma factor [Ensifer sp. ENS09]|uniref:sigma-70 family RNA polymerase sigma factor n=1 Tax=Ensifer sp. ENS09 TaxID=2769263 RepID=UPI00178774DD|nr:sigma-70 family RNA polymerase sigma factor [Ensifer sp. ENS09]MBD9650161.1 sigma-70 family RNA polymerase sigma factor [Ensifer sp. ENS09]
MFDRQQSGYILPEGFSVVSKVFDKILDARNISRHSEEGERLARHALMLYMGGISGPLELEHQLGDPSHDYREERGKAQTTIVNLLSELLAHARSLCPSYEAATDLTEQTLEYAIEHVDEFGDGSDVKEWLVRMMVEIHLRRSHRLP